MPEGLECRQEGLIISFAAEHPWRRGGAGFAPADAEALLRALRPLLQRMYVNGLRIEDAEAVDTVRLLDAVTWDL